MSSLVPMKPSSPMADDRTTAEVPVTSYLYLNKTDSGCQTLEKDAILRRIRYRKRVNHLRNALQSCLQAMPGKEKDSEHLTWLDDAFSSP